jgi:chemotaxis family two-component system sensor kinase Cph1
MHALIDDLLSLSRVTSKRVIIGPASVSKMLDRALENLEVTIKESRVLIEQDPLPSLAVDNTQIILLFQNLISNAIKFRSEEKPKIHIGAEQQKEYWLFNVTDNGIGFKQKYIDRIFLPFRRLHARERYPGTGIGLAICKKIVEQHGGTIWAKSEIGKGSTFYFTIKDAKNYSD